LSDNYKTAKRVNALVNDMEYQRTKKDGKEKRRKKEEDKTNRREKDGEVKKRKRRMGLID